MSPPVVMQPSLVTFQWCKPGASITTSPEARMAVAAVPPSGVSPTSAGVGPCQLGFTGAGCPQPTISKVADEGTAFTRNGADSVASLAPHVPASRWMRNRYPEPDGTASSRAEVALVSSARFHAVP